jgi:hypothetical protein
VKPDAVGTFRVLVKARLENLKGKSTDLTFVAKDAGTGKAYRRETVFAGP